MEEMTKEERIAWLESELERADRRIRTLAGALNEGLRKRIASKIESDKHIKYLETQISGYEIKLSELTNRGTLDYRSYLTKITDLKNQNNDLYNELNKREKMLDELLDAFKKIMATEPAPDFGPAPEPIAGPYPEPEPSQIDQAGFLFDQPFRPDPSIPGRWVSKNYIIMHYDTNSNAAFGPVSGHFRAYCYGVTGWADGSRIPTNAREFKTWEEAWQACAEHAKKNL